jgi:hypothetical protein
MLALTFFSLALLPGCGQSPEPLVLPDDPAERGVPVGYRTSSPTIGGSVERWFIGVSPGFPTTRADAFVGCSLHHMNSLEEEAGWWKSSCCSCSTE